MRTYEHTRNHAGPAPIPLPALRRPGADGAASAGPVTLHYTPGVGHDFSRMRVHGDRRTAPWLDDAGPQPGRLKGGESFPDEEGQASDPELKRAAGPDAGVPADAGAGSGSGSGSAKAAAPTLAASGDNYSADTATESHKAIRFDVTVPSGVTAADYALVNKLKGSQKDGAGKAFKVTMYGKTVDFDFADWQVDSLDEDPVYWSDSSARRNYKATATGFYATDNPGPALSTETGAVYAVKFKMGLYKLSDLPAKTTGSISATPLAEYDWQYSVVVDSHGKFTHPAI